MIKHGWLQIIVNFSLTELEPPGALLGNKNKCEFEFVMEPGRDLELE